MFCFDHSRAHGDHHDRLDRAVRLLQVCRDGLQQFQIPGASVLLDTVLSLVKKIQATKANAKAIELLSEEIYRLSEVLVATMRRVQDKLENRLSDAESRRQIDEVLREPSLLQQRVAALCGELQRLDGRARDLGRGRFLCRCLHAKRDSRVLQELNDGLSKALEAFKFAGHITIEALVDEMLHHFTAVQKEVVLAREEIIAVWTEMRRVDSNNQVDRDDRILDQLPHAEAGFQTSSQAAKSHHVDGTFTRVLEELEAWAKGDSDATFERLRKPVWVLSEAPGSGKSTIASTFCRRLWQGGLDPALGASFFFDLAVADLSTTRDFFSTVAYQLAHSQPTLRPLIVTAAREHLIAGKNQQMGLTVENLLLKPLRALAQQQPLTHPIVIVVDGVDECADHAIDALPKMLRFLVACAQVPSSPIRILLTTRLSATVESVLEAPELREMVHRHHLHDRSEAMAIDITTYLRTRLGGLEPLQRRPTAVNKLASHVGPSFAYAQALADFVLAHPSHLKIALSLEPESAHPSASLCALYTAITAHTSRLDTQQWRRMRERVERPSVLDLCGASTCYKRVTSWLRSPRMDVLASGSLPRSLLDNLCSQCRVTLEKAPLEAWILKRIITSLVKSGSDTATVLPPIPLEGHVQEDPWQPGSPATSRPRTADTLLEPRIDRKETIQLPCPDIANDPAAGTAVTDPFEYLSIARVLPADVIQHGHTATEAPLLKASIVNMPIAQPLKEHFVGGFVTQVQASMAAVSPQAVSPQTIPPLPDMPHQAPQCDTTAIPTPTAPTTTKPRPPKLRITIADPPPHTTTPVPSSSPARTHKTPVEIGYHVHSLATVRGVAASTPRGSPPHGSPRAKRVLLLQRLGTPIQKRAPNAWDVRRGSPRMAAGSPLWSRTGARPRDLGQKDSPPSRRESPRSPLAVTSPSPKRGGTY